MATVEDTSEQNINTELEFPLSDELKSDISLSKAGIEYVVGSTYRISKHVILSNSEDVRNKILDEIIETMNTRNVEFGTGTLTWSYLLSLTQKLIDYTKFLSIVQNLSGMVGFVSEYGEESVYFIEDCILPERVLFSDTGGVFSNEECDELPTEGSVEWKKTYRKYLSLVCPNATYRIDCPNNVDIRHFRVVKKSLSSLVRDFGWRECYLIHNGGLVPINLVYLIKFFRELYSYEGARNSYITTDPAILNVRVNPKYEQTENVFPPYEYLHFIYNVIARGNEQRFIDYIMLEACRVKCSVSCLNTTVVYQGKKTNEPDGYATIIGRLKAAYFYPSKSVVAVRTPEDNGVLDYIYFAARGVKVYYPITNVINDVYTDNTIEILSKDYCAHSITHELHHDLANNRNYMSKIIDSLDKKAMHRLYYWLYNMELRPHSCSETLEKDEMISEESSEVEPIIKKVQKLTPVKNLPEDCSETTQSDSSESEESKSPRYDAKTKVFVKNLTAFFTSVDWEDIAQNDDIVIGRTNKIVCKSKVNVWIKCSSLKREYDKRYGKKYGTISVTRLKALSGELDFVVRKKSGVWVAMPINSFAEHLAKNSRAARKLFEQSK